MILKTYHYPASYCSGCNRRFEFISHVANLECDQCVEANEVIDHWSYMGQDQDCQDVYDWRRGFRYAKAEGFLDHLNRRWRITGTDDYVGSYGDQ